MEVAQYVDALNQGVYAAWWDGAFNGTLLPTDSTRWSRSKTLSLPITQHEKLPQILRDCEEICVRTLTAASTGTGIRLFLIMR